MKIMARILGWLAVGLVIAASGVWAVGVLVYAGPHNDWLRNILAAGFALALLSALTTIALRRWRRQTLTVYLLLLTAVAIWWRGIEPSNTRDWQTDVAVLASATVDGDIVTVRNIRNFSYRSETDYSAAYYDKSFDLRRLEGVDVVAVYWMGPAIAHVFLSFAFAGGNHLAISIETRKESGESYSTIKGFFRQYELYYVVADERDVIRLRTNYRRDPPEDVYVYRAAAPIENGRKLFLEYLRQVNALNTIPEFYNTLTTNCTTSIWLNTRVNAQHLPLNWQILVSGYLPQFLYEHDRLETAGLTFAELQRRALINRRAQAADAAADFSQRIRTVETGVPIAMPAHRANTVLTAPLYSATSL
jgi:uncharacterized protein DUF4105